MESKLSKERILSTFLGNHPESASLILMKSAPKQIAELISKMPESSITESLTLLPVGLLEESLALLNNSILVKIIGNLNINLTRTIIYQWRLKHRIDNQRIEAIFQALDPKYAASVRRLLRFPPSTLGSIMNPTPFAVRENLTVGEVLSLLRKEKGRYNKYIYITNDTSALHGVVTFKDLFYAKSDELISALMSLDIYSFAANENINTAFENPSWRSWDSIPIVDSDRKLIGLIRYKTLVKEVLKEENIKIPKNVEISKAGTAISEIFQIGIAASFSTMMIPIEGRKK